MTIKKPFAFFAASLIAFAATAQESESGGEGSEAAGGEAAAAEGLPQIAKVTEPAAFASLPFCRESGGVAEVCKPGSEKWEQIEDGRFYPLGSSYRTGLDGHLVLAFGQASCVSIEASSSFTTRPQKIGEKVRGIVLGPGKLKVSLPDNMREGAFFVSAPGFTVKNPAGESRYAYELTGDGDRATVRCVTGALAVDGKHFSIPVMHAANEVVIRTSNDHLVTFLYGTSGDYVVKLDQGVRLREEFDNDGKVKQIEEVGVLDWHLSPATKVIINRSLPAIGERMSVHTMAFDASGERKSECSFCEGRAEVNSGELVAKESLKGDELAKRAAEATETTTAADVEEDSSSSSSSSSDSSSDSSESSGPEE